MADTKISALTALTGSGVDTTADVLPIVDTSATTTKKILLSELAIGLNVATTAISYVIDGGGSVITTGVKGDLSVPFACTINSVTLIADQSGSIVIDIWKDTLANYPPTVADTITAAAKPTLSSATNSTDTTLTGWTKTITAGDTLRFNVDSITTCTRVTLILKVTR